MVGKKLTDPLNGLEYLDIIKNKQTILTLNKEHLNGKTKRELELILGSKLGSGRFNFRAKFLNDNTPLTGMVRAVNPNAADETNKQTSGAIDKRLEAIENKITRASQGGGLDINLVIEMLKQTYNTQIDFLKARIVQLETDNKQLREQLATAAGQSGGLLDQIAPLLLVKMLGPDAAKLIPGAGS